MIRTLKAFGLFLLAACAVSAAVASAAQASLFFTVSSTPASITATDYSAVQEWNIAGMTIACTKVSGSATQKDVWAYEMLVGGIKYEECEETKKSLPTTVTMNNCSYKLTVEFEESSYTAEGTTHITKCTKAIEINVNSGECLIKIGEQKLGNITYFEQTLGSYHNISTTLTLTKLGASYKGKLCGNKAEEDFELNGTFNGKILLDANPDILSLDP